MKCELKTMKNRFREKWSFTELCKRQPEFRFECFWVSISLNIILETEDCMLKHSMHLRLLLSLTSSLPLTFMCAIKFFPLFLWSIVHCCHCFMSVKATRTVHKSQRLQLPPAEYLSAYGCPWVLGCSVLADKIIARWICWLCGCRSLRGVKVQSFQSCVWAGGHISESLGYDALILMCVSARCVIVGVRHALMAPWRHYGRGWAQWMLCKNSHGVGLFVNTEAHQLWPSHM